MNDRTPPQCIDVECAVLGSMLLERDAIYIASRILRADSFYKPAHQTIFQRLIDLYEKDIDANLISLTQELKQNGELESIGGEYYLTELTTKISSAANVEYQSHVVFESALKRLVIQASSSISEESFSDTSDIFDLISSIQNLDIELMGRVNACKSYDKLSLLNAFVQYIQDKNNKKKFPTGFPTLDRMLKGGLPTGGYSILGGDPGAGKTSWMLSAALHMAKQNHNVCFIEGEMPTHEIFERMNGIWSGVDIDEIVSGNRYDELTKPFISMIHNIPFTLVKNFDRTIEALVADIKHAVYKKADIVFIDYLQVFAPRGKSDNEFSAIKLVSETIRSLSLKNPIHICVASAYTRDAEFYGSNLLKFDASQLLRLNFDKEDKSKRLEELTNPRRDITLEVEKNRGGARGDLSIRYFLDSQKMIELDESGQYVPPAFNNNNVIGEHEESTQTEAPF